MLKSIKIIFSYIVGLAIWLICYGAGILFSVFNMQLSVDNYITIGLIAFISSLIGTYLAFGFMELIHPTFEDLVAYLFIAIFALLWIGSAIVYETGEYRVGELRYKVVGFAMAQLGILMTYKTRNIVLFK